MKLATFVNTLAVTSTFAFGNATKSSTQDSSNDGKRTNARRGKKKTKNEDFPKNDGFLKSIPMGGSVAAAAKDTFWLCGYPNPKLLYTFDGGPRASWVKDGNIVDIKEIPLIKTKVTMESEFCIDTSETQRRLYGNGIPNHKIGTFPIPKKDPAYSYYAGHLDPFGCYDAAEIPVFPYIQDITVPRFPKYNEEPTCIGTLTLGVATKTGVPWHVEYATINPNPEPNDPATLLPYDACWGHPVNGIYHIHGKSWTCFPDQGRSHEHSPLYGFGLDGFGIYGPRSEHGKLVTNEDLDECHGHIHEITWEGEKVEMYHYHVNREFPYTLGCFRGTPVKLIENISSCIASDINVTSVETMTEANPRTTCLGNRQVTKE